MINHYNYDDDCYFFFYINICIINMSIINIITNTIITTIIITIIIININICIIITDCIMIINNGDSNINNINNYPI